MIQRYTRPEMGELWTAQSRFQCLLDVEVAVAKAQAHLKVIPPAAYEDIRRKGRFSVARIEELEKTTKHDIIAFVSAVAETVGENGRYLHYGMTSSDVLDTALSVQVRKAGRLLGEGFARAEAALVKLARQHGGTLCAGRTHGMHAEITSFGYKLAGHWAEFQRTRERVERALAQMAMAKLSGAVGTYSTQPLEVEAQVAQELGLKPETVATQVIPRDRHAELIWALAMTGAAIERLAVELRHLQRTEVGEVVENFAPGQKGSSAMPHKKNPISAENLTGVARLLRAHVSAALENIALWHERDISHSSVERVIFPDAFILADYGLHRMADLLEGLHVNAERMRQNMELSGGSLLSSQVLLALIDQGLAREEAYRLVQRLALALRPGEHLAERLLADAEAKKFLSEKQVRELFSGRSLQARMVKRLEQLLPGKGKNNHGTKKGPTAVRGKSETNVRRPRPR